MTSRDHPKCYSSLGWGRAHASFFNGFVGTRFESRGALVRPMAGQRQLAALDLESVVRGDNQRQLC